MGCGNFVTDWGIVGGMGLGLVMMAVVAVVAVVIGIIEVVVLLLLLIDAVIGVVDMLLTLSITPIGGIIH